MVSSRRPGRAIAVYRGRAWWRCPSAEAAGMAVHGDVSSGVTAAVGGEEVVAASGQTILLKNEAKSIVNRKQQ